MSEHRSEFSLRRSIDQPLLPQGASQPGFRHRLARGWHGFGLWFGDALAYAMGRPAEAAAVAPPPLGVQPYHGVVASRRTRHGW